jgi:hypothetical protein
MGRASGGGASGGSGASRHAGGAAGRLATIARRITGTQPTAPDAATKPKSKKADTKHAKDKTKDKAKGKKLDTPKVTGKGKKGAGKRPKPPHRRIGRAWRSTRRRVRAAYRWASPRIARALIRTRMTLVRWRTRANLVRLRHLGPNWWPGIAKAWAAVMNGLIKAGGSIAFLPATRRWIAGYMPRKVDVADITLGPVSSNVRVIYTSTPTTGAPPMADPVIIEAAEQIRNAFATIAADPASSMRGYEAALLALPDLLEAIGEGLNGFADVTRDQFSVQEAVPDMLGEGASHAQGLGSFLADVHAHYRSLHEQQITNYEEPTVGSEKWDVVANQE